MKRHVLLILLRVLLTAGVFYSLPYSYLKWGESLPDDTQERFGMFMMLLLIGAGSAVAYLAIGTAFQFFQRRRGWRSTAITDGALFLVIAGVLTYSGITARDSTLRSRDAEKLRP